jgi:iron(III) transport system substrate-binding protein
VLRRPLIVCAAVLALAACGGSDAESSGRSPADVAAEVEGLRGEELTAKLAELAKDEDGTLSIYTSLSDPIGEQIADRFSEEYGIEVSIYAANSNVVAQRLTEETKAGRRLADVAEMSTTVLVSLDENGVLADALPVDTEGIDENIVDESWVGIRHNRFAVSWNTDEVSDGSEPTSWEDLADPRWDGKLGLELDDFDWYAGLRTYWEEQGKSADEIDRLFAAMVDGSKVIAGHSLLTELTASGEISVAASSFSHIADRATNDGAPVAWRPAVEPTFLRAQGMGVVESTRRPATAALFIQWALTDGQKLYAANDWVPARPSEGKDEGDVVVLDVKAISAQEERWASEYATLVRRGELVPEEDD